MPHHDRQTCITKASRAQGWPRPPSQAPIHRKGHGDHQLQDRHHQRQGRRGKDQRGSQPGGRLQEASSTRSVLFDADIHGPSVPKMTGIKTEMRDLLHGSHGIDPVVNDEGLKVMSVALIWPTDMTPIMWSGTVQGPRSAGSFCKLHQVARNGFSTSWTFRRERATSPSPS